MHRRAQLQKNGRASQAAIMPLAALVADQDEQVHKKERQVAQKHNDILSNLEKRSRPVKYILSGAGVSKHDEFLLKTRNSASKTRNCVFKTKYFVFKTMNFAGPHRS